MSDWFEGAVVIVFLKLYALPGVLAFFKGLKFSISAWHIRHLLCVLDAAGVDSDGYLLSVPMPPMLVISTFCITI